VASVAAAAGLAGLPATAEERTDDAAAGFADVFGGLPDGVWAAPGRVNLIGEHTDYNDGFVLPFALPHAAVVAGRVASSPGAGWSVHSAERDESVSFGAADLTPGGVDGWAAYVAGVVWALREAGHEVPAAELYLTSDVPVGAGLSSSAAVECSTLAALLDLAGPSGPDLDGMQRARLAQRAENDFVGVPCGIMDQAASTLCREGAALFLDTRSSDVEHVPLALADDGLVVLVVDTRAPHELRDGDYADRRSACEEAARLLGVPALRDVTEDDLPDALERLGSADVLRRRVRHVVTEDARVLETVARLRAGDPRSVGPLLTASHASLRDDYEVTVPQLDVAAAAAVDAGAYGARMTGAGFGGCVIALVDADRVDEVAGGVRAAFSAAGFTEPATFLAVPAAGARRLA